MQSTKPAMQPATQPVMQPAMQARAPTLNRTLSSALKLWLNLQCQMVTDTAQAVLVEHVVGAPNKILAKWPEDATAGRDIIDAAKQVMTKQRTHLAPVDGYLLLGQPVFVDDTFWGAVVLRITQRDQTAVGAALKLLKWGMTWLQYLLFQQEHAPPPAVVSLLAQVLKEDTLTEAAITTVNRMGAELRCERVCLGLLQQNHVDIKAVSRSANFDKRTGALQLIAFAMDEAVDQRVDIVYPPQETTDASPQIVRCHEQLQQESKAAHIHTFLLRREQHLVGALLLESAAALSPAERIFIDQCLPVLTDIFYLRQQASVGPWHRFKTTCTRSLQRWWGQDYWKGKAITAAAFVFLLLLLVPADYQVHGEAVLQSTEKRVLVANQDGYLATVNARPGDVVMEGEVLAEMDDEDLRLERRKLASQLQQFRQEYDNALATAQRAQAAVASAQVEQASIQLRLVEQELERTQLASPMDGIIVSGDISQSVGAPVQQGDVLFEVAASGGYRVVLYVDERDVARVNTEHEGKLVLTSLPGQTFAFDVTRITPISEVRDGRNYFRVEGDLASDDDILRPGMTGSGRILAGRQALGWIWFHGLIDWLRLVLWL